MQWWRRVAIAGLVAWGLAGQIQALESNNYRIDEAFIGGGGLEESSSANITGRDMVGEIGIGNSSSTNFQIDAGFQTTDEPNLTFFIPDQSIDFGELSMTSTKTATATFTVLNYTAFGYIVQTISEPPANGGTGQRLSGVNPRAASQTGTEQFGINLVFNDEFCGVGCDLGANPVQEPDATFGFGEAEDPDYDLPNEFKYVVGDIIARGPKSSGRTTFTISYIVNASSTTPGGSYSGKHDLVVVGTY